MAIKKNKLKHLSLFSGLGGIDLGFNQAGFQTIFSTDNSEDCVETLKKNFKEVVIECKDIRDLDINFLREKLHKNFKNIDIVTGGPPCPPFSKSRFYRKDFPKGMDDPEANNVKEYFRIIQILKPKFFLFENVPAITSKRQNGAFEYILKTADELKYKTKFQVINAADYGVPQKRERFIMIGYKSNYHFTFPETTHAKSSDQTNLLLKKWVTAGDVINDLDTKKNSDDKGHFAGGKDHELLKKIPPGDNYLFFTKKRNHPNPQFEWRSRYWSFLLKLSPDLPSWTIQARRSNNMGPFHWKNRILRIEEIKRLQTIPDSFNIHGNIESQWRQVGNSVPPLLMKKIAQQIKYYLLNNGEKKINKS